MNLLLPARCKGCGERVFLYHGVWVSAHACGKVAPNGNGGSAAQTAPRHDRPSQEDER